MIERVSDDRRILIGLGVVLAYSLLYWVPGSPFPEYLPWGVIAQGIIFGSSYALLGMGLILIYRTSRIVNFAYGAMGAMPGALTVGLFTAKGWNYFLAIVVGVLVGIVTGALIELMVIRRFAKSSRLVLTVASIGLAQILGAIGLGIGVALGTDTLIGDIRTPLSGDWFIRPYPLRGDHLLMIGVVPVVLLGLAWYLLRTDAGVAVRAAAENQDRALLLGIPVRRLQTIVWAAVAGGLSALTFITKAPFTGVVPDALVGATVILPGLAVAAVAQFKSLPVALWAGLGLGIAEWTIRWNVSAESIFDVTFFVVILAALLFRKVQTSRAETGESSWDAAGVLKPIPVELRRLPEVLYLQRGLFAILAVLLLVIPLQAAPSTVSVMSQAIIWCTVGVSLVILTGWGGNVSLGQFAIVGVGALATGNLMMRWNVDFIVCAIIGTLAGALIAVGIGIPALRIKGLYLAVTTLAFAVALDSYFLNPVNFPGYIPTSLTRPVLWKRFEMSEWSTFYLSLGVLVLSILVMRSIRHKRPGRVIIGTRDNDRAADAFGVPTTKVKVQTFALSGAIAGLAGSLYMLVYAQIGIGTGTFQPAMSIAVFSFATIGGLSSIAGAVSGVAMFRILDFVIDKNFSGATGDLLRLSLSGGGLLFILYFLPGGLWQMVQRWRDRYLRAIARRRGLVVPSLVADLRVEDVPPEATAEAVEEAELVTALDDDHPEDESELIGGALR